MPLVTDRDKGAHLLRRFGLGASEAELDFYLRDGLNGAIDRLLDYSSVDEALDVDARTLVNDRGQLRLPQLVSWWSLRMLTTRRPLQEKMTLFWHDHFATSASKVQQGPLMLQQNETLRRHATGSFKTFLTEMSKDPAMLFWLDNQENVRGKPNENFAREVMELFTLGIGNYTEQDVQEAARAFTGWAFVRERPQEGQPRGQARFIFRPGRHDAGPKTILGKTAAFSGEQLLDLLCDHPRTAEYLTQKVWEWFAYADPEPALIERHARIFRASGLDIKELLRSIMRSSEFYSAKAERKIVKNPVDFCVATLRQLGVGEMASDLARRAGTDGAPRASMQSAAIAANSMKSMGMWLLYPPDVAGWESGQAWITSATMVERIGWADRIFSPTRQGRQSLRYPAYGLLQADPTPQGVVKKLTSVFDVPPLKAERTKVLLSAAEKATGGRLTPDNASETAASVSRLIFATPEFQFA